MRDPNDRIEVLLFHDVLCGWSYLADERLRGLQEELDGLFTIDYRPFPVRLEEMLPSKRERQAEIRALRKVGRQPDGEGVRPDLWRSDDPPRSSLSPLVALEAARIVGGTGARDRLLRAMRRGAFELGLNVSRDDVLIELAERCGIELGRFSTALRSAGTRRLVTGEHERARARGIEAVPAAVVGGEWLLRGCRSVDEYRDAILRYVERRGLHVAPRVVH